MSHIVDDPADTMALRGAAAIHRDLIRIGRAVRSTTGDNLLSPSQMSALWTIAQHAPIRATELADRERVAAPTMSRVAASLEHLGMVVRTTDAHDGRVSLLALSDAGSAHLAGASSRNSALFESALDALTDPDRRCVERSMRLLADTVCALTPTQQKGT
ncbi:MULTISPECIES: MarR family winged helix-turn-helix transcriptional regulator [Gordonia]|jgi:DNA-binding MarR family transcriptional regulator|uniref:MarR family transcriptional regulator n=1 Tax=Gordonia tangerina TaxID=2911060 RepID=A0ABS9DDJ7_9ACTN|nr:MULTISPECIES: MarR family transcriptional regulator [Gordonia]MCF3937285.1 MarR family transcriptional regulator [Gordonia tangerina]